MGENAGGRERARVAIEALALALLSALPLLPYFLYLVDHGVPRFAFEGDYAGLELATRFVPSQGTLLGPYSRFGFNHPGPLYFYALAPIYALWGRTSTGIFAGACAINALSAMTVVVAVRLATTRAHAIAVTLVVLAWLAAFGDVCPLPWNPLVVVLPMIAFLVLAALVACGRWSALPFAVLAGAFVSETHLSTVPSVLGISVATTLVVALRARSHPLGRRAKVWLLMSAAVLVLAVLPPVIEELGTPNGNLTKLTLFFVRRPGPLRPFSSALVDWSLATSWLPDRLLSTSLLSEAFPDVMRSEAPLDHLTVTALRATVVLAVLSLAAFAVSLRRCDYPSVGLLGVGALASVVAASALRAIVGVNYTYLLFWTTAATTLLWMGVASTLAIALADLFARPSRATIAPIGAGAAVAVALVAALGTCALQRDYLARNALAPTASSDVRGAFDALRARITATGETPVMHAAGAWHIGLALMLEASKDDLDPRVVPRDRWIFGRQPRGVVGLAHALHVYAEVPGALIPFRECLQRLGTFGSVELYTSATDVDVCPTPSTPHAPPAP